MRSIPSVCEYPASCITLNAFHPSVNVIGTLSLVDLCVSRGIHISNFATGCIYSYDEDHPIGGKGFTEEDEPNFSGSFYSHTKVNLEVADRCVYHISQCVFVVHLELLSTGTY